MLKLMMLNYFLQPLFPNNILQSLQYISHCVLHIFSISNLWTNGSTFAPFTYILFVLLYNAFNFWKPLPFRLLIDFCGICSVFIIFSISIKNTSSIELFATKWITFCAPSFFKSFSNCALSTGGFWLTNSKTSSS